MTASTARIATTMPGVLIRRLCKHWGHKFPVTYDEQHGDVSLSKGRCTMKVVDGTLEVRVDVADEADLQHIEQVVAEHLQRMAGKEQLEFAWQRAA